ncbi:MAG: 7-carboxy-7-deazaguanine synthase QueE [Pseudomonadota bacterium]
MKRADTLRITEIFRSLQGEGDAVGFPTVFVRLTGCPLRCQYCDTAYAFTGGKLMSMPDILATVAAFNTRHVCVTGGEPLAQANCVLLLAQLCDAGYRVSLETSGAMALAGIDARVAKVVDVKTPASGEERRNRYEELAALGQHDQVKFVICDRADYEWSRAKTAELELGQRAMVLFSPSHEQLSARDLADWILADGIAVRMQVQLHKILWGNEPGR